MAIHPEVPGLTVCVNVAGKDLPDYEDEDAQDAPHEVVTKYIEAISGARFNMSVRFNHAEFQYANQTVVVSTECDGKTTSKRCFNAKDMASDTSYLFGDWVATGRAGKLIKRNLIFSDLAINEGQANKDLFGKLNDLGTITLKWYRANLRPRRSCKANLSSAKGPLVEGQLPEGNLKGQSLTHHTTYGTERQVGRPFYTADKIGEPFAIFKFKYRSQGALQSLGLLPRSPSPVPLEDRDIDDLTREEMRELLRRQQRQRGSSEAPVKREIKREIKRERIDFEDHGDDDDDVEIVDRPEKRIRLDADGAGVDVVDLCGDD